MSKFADAYVEISGDDKPFDRDLNAVRGKLSRFASMAKLSVPIGIVGGAAALAGAVGYLKEAVGRGADLGETMSKVRTVFGDSADILIGKADELSSKFGVVRQEALSAGSNIGLIAKGAGYSADAAARLASQFTQLAADAASFHNVEVSDALEKIRAGLTGESEPLKAFGVLLNESAMKSEALRLGLNGANGELTEAAKVAARASLIMSGMADAQGDLARTSDSTANQMKRLRGQWVEFQTALGQKLLPVVDRLTPLLNNLTGALGKFGASAGLQSSVDAFETLLVGANELDRLLKQMKFPALGAGSAGLFSGSAGLFSSPAATIRAELEKQARLAQPSALGAKWQAEQEARDREAEARKIQGSPAAAFNAGKLSEKDLIDSNRHILRNFGRQLLETPLSGQFMERNGQPAARLSREAAEGLRRRGVPITALRGDLSVGALGRTLLGGLQGAARDSIGGWLPDSPKRPRFEASMSDQFPAIRDLQLQVMNAGKAGEKEKGTDKTNELLGQLLGAFKEMLGVTKEQGKSNGGTTLKGPE